MKEPLRNYHTHTTLCRHAEGTMEEYVLNAIETGYDVLGFSDHTPWPHMPGVNLGGRMAMPEEFEGYVRSVHELKEKYADKIHIMLGLECEYLPEYADWLKKLAADHEIEYLVFGNHFDRAANDRFNYPDAKTPTQVAQFVDHCIAGMESGLFCYLAHPDIVLKHYGDFNAETGRELERLCVAAKRLNMPIEYNLWGVHLFDMEKDTIGLGYPCPQFWQIAADVGCEAVVGSDAHRAWCLKKPDWVAQAYDVLEHLGIRVLKDYVPSRPVK